MKGGRRPPSHLLSLYQNRTRLLDLAELTFDSALVIIAGASVIARRSRSSRRRGLLLIDRSAYLLHRLVQFLVGPLDGLDIAPLERRLDRLYLGLSLRV